MRKTAFNRILSLICTLALLLSMCPLSVLASAETVNTYTLNVNGVNETIELELGSPIPDPNVPYEFLGWYDSLEFDNKVETAGDAKTLYAKFSSVVLNFDEAANGGVYDPNNKFTNWWSIVDDPTDVDNKALKAKNIYGRFNIGIPVYAGAEEGFTLQNDQKYEISFRYNIISTGTTPISYVNVSPMTCLISGVGQNGGGKNQNYKGLNIGVTNGAWATGSFLITGNNITEDNKYLVFSFLVGNYNGSSVAGAIYFDDIVVTPINGEKTYTMHDRSKVTTVTMTPGDELSVGRGSFLGWYDKSLTYKYENAPALTTELYAVYSNNTYTFENGLDDIYDPNGKFNSANVAIVEDGDNKAVKITHDGSNRYGYSVLGALGANGGYRLQKGKVYKVSFKYKATGGDVVFFATSGAGVSVNGNKKELGWKPTITKTDEWTLFEGEFAVPSSVDVATMPYLYITSYSDTDGYYVMLDDLTISLKAAEASTDPAYMDFEDKNGEGFKWSVADANKYTVSSGNGYVNRGEIVEADGNKYFRVKHFGARNANIYFTIDDGAKQFKMVNGGIYTLRFDYKVEHSETPSKLGLAYVLPTTASTGLRYQTVTVFDEFENRDDTEWTTVEYTFYADLYDNPTYTSLGLYVFNSTNVPEYNIDTGLATATSVLFDNIEVITRSAYGDECLITFDSKGGSECSDLLAKVDFAVGMLPKPERYGYNFAGWKFDVTDVEGNTTTYDLNEDYIISYSDYIINAYATWELAEGFIELNFRTNIPEFDDNVPSVVAYPGEYVSNVPDPIVLDGYTFNGWYYDREFKKPFNQYKAPSESCDVFAKWEFEHTTDYEKYAGMPGATDRMTLEELEDGNHVIFYDFSKGSNQSNTSSICGAMLHNGEDFVQVVKGKKYTVSFRYKVLEANSEGEIGFILSGKSSLWSNRLEQSVRIPYGQPDGEWHEATVTFTALTQSDTKSNNNYLSIGVSNDCKLYIDDVVVVGEPFINVYGTAIHFDYADSIYGDPGDPIVLPTPEKEGYEFRGWFTDYNCTIPFTDTHFGQEEIYLYSSFKKCVDVESFENYTDVRYNVNGYYRVACFNHPECAKNDKYIHYGNSSLFRNGLVEGLQFFENYDTNTRSIEVGEEYTVYFYVKPVEVRKKTGSIYLAFFNGYNGYKLGDYKLVEVAKYQDLEFGKWNRVEYTFTAETEYFTFATTDGNDMYFDSLVYKFSDYQGESIEQLQIVDSSFTMPNKTTFVRGEDIILDGFNVITYHNRGSNSIDYSKHFNTDEYKSTVGIKPIKLEYRCGCEIEFFNIEVIEKPIKCMDIYSMPEKMSYRIGEEFDSTGLVLTVSFQDGTIELITENIEIIGYNPQKVGYQTITVKYFTHSVDISVNVIAEDEAKLVIDRVETFGNETVDVYFSIEGVANIRTFGITNITYDTSKLQLLDGEVLLKNAMLSSWNKNTQSVAYLFSENVNVSGKVLKLTFKVLDYSGADQYDIGCTVVAKYTNSNDVEQNLDISVFNGGIVIVEQGDLVGCDGLNSDDVTYLLYSTLFGDEEYPLNQSCDYNGDGVIDSSDAVYLLYHFMFGELYPLN